MAKTVDEQTKFIELRAKGHSFDKIAQEIKTSKPTILKWQKEFISKISEAKFLHFESLAEQSLVMKQQRLEYLSGLYQKLKQELESRDFSKVSTDKLIEIYFKTENRLLDEFETVKHTTSETLPDEFNYDDLLLNKIVKTEYKIDTCKQDEIYWKLPVFLTVKWGGHRPNKLIDRTFQIRFRFPKQVW